MEPPRSPQLARRGGAAGADVPEAEGGRRPRRWSQAASTEGAKPLRDNGRGGIRTHDTVFAVYTLSRRPGARPDSGIVTDFHRAEGSIRRPSTRFDAGLRTRNLAPLLAPVGHERVSRPDVPGTIDHSCSHPSTTSICIGFIRPPCTVTLANAASDVTKIVRRQLDLPQVRAAMRCNNRGEQPRQHAAVSYSVPMTDER
jgi:hypothetical protein